MIRLPLCLIALALVFPATSAAKTTVCPSNSVLESTEVKNVKCGKAKKVLKDYFKNGSPAKGYDCKQKQYEGGAKTTCKKGDKKILYFVAD